MTRYVVVHGKIPSGGRAEVHHMILNQRGSFRVNGGYFESIEEAEESLPEGFMILVVDSLVLSYCQIKVVGEPDDGLLNCPVSDVKIVLCK